MAQLQLKREDDHRKFIEVVDSPALEILSPPAAPQVRFIPEPQFAHDRRPTFSSWLGAGMLMAGLFAVGTASGHPVAAIVAGAVVGGIWALIAWGNWVLDNTVEW